ncbi:hypothetical protein FOMA001_g7342 [Fusarium oxysporum f. sp. matthiolae]|nr:hypothetical protein FOMA001_g7342 [Fusarium oxysporum f. sp. matthiolae]
MNGSLFSGALSSRKPPGFPYVTSGNGTYSLCKEETEPALCAFPGLIRPVPRKADIWSFENFLFSTPSNE